MRDPFISKLHSIALWLKLKSPMSNIYISESLLFVETHKIYSYSDENRPSYGLIDSAALNAILKYCRVTVLLAYFLAAQNSE